MALSYPLSLANLVNLLHVESAVINLMQQQEFSGLGTGEGMSHDLGPPLYDFDCSTAQFPHADVEKWRARFNTLDGSNNAFLIYPPQAAYPSTDPDGALLDGHSVQIKAIEANRKELSFKGLPNDFAIPWGAYLSITYGTSRIALVQLVADATADGSGDTGAVEVRPHLRPGILADAAVSLIKPVAKVKLLPNTLRVEIVGALHSRLRFVARQTLAAD